MGNIAQSILPEYDHEMSVTRTVLKRLPQSKYAWKPHDRSFSVGEMASHVVNVPSWLENCLQEDSFDVAPPGGEPFRTPEYHEQAALLAAFDHNVAKGRSVIANTDDAAFMKTWSMLKGGETMFSMPRVVVLRSFILNHLVHHRGQLTVYLRLLGEKVPSVYGPSADEGQM